MTSIDDKRDFLKRVVVPTRIALSRGWEEMINYLLSTISTSGELGILINLESQTRKTYKFLSKHDELIKSIADVDYESEFILSDKYTLQPRFVVLNERSILDDNDDYYLRATVLGQKDNSVKPVLMYRVMGKGDFKEKEMIHEGNNTYKVKMPISSEGSIEFFLQTKIENKYIYYPATSPELNHVVVGM